jgi:hypothetical protein
VRRVGGCLEARWIHDLCAALGVPVWCGGMLETGLGRAANVALAALPGFTLPGDTSASDRYFRTDLTEPFVLRDGHLSVPAGPGLGVEPLPEVLRAVTTATEWLPSETDRFCPDSGQDQKWAKAENNVTLGPGGWPRGGERGYRRPVR